MPHPTRQQQAAATLELCNLAIALGSPKVTFSEAMSTARAARPDLAQTVDGGRFRPSPATAPAARSGSPPAVPVTAHAQLLALAEKVREAHPGLSSEAAYSQALTAHPDLYDDYLAERADTAMPLHFGEGIGPQLQQVQPDAEYSSKPALWSARAKELFQAGRYPTIEQAYVGAMENR